MSIIVRPAVESDSRFFFDLRGVDAYQKFSTYAFNVTFEDHSLWFKQRLQSCIDILFLASHQSGKDIGYVRFEPDSSLCAFRLSFAIVPSELGKGYSKPMILGAINKLRASADTFDCVSIIASVHTANIPSQRALAGAGFRKLYRPKQLSTDHVSSYQYSDYSVYALHIAGFHDAYGT